MIKNIFITGAASGIGKATAIYFAKKGWNVGLFDINEEGLIKVANEIGHNSCMYKKLDVTNLDQWTDAVSAYSEYTNGTCNLFFNNAGIAAFTGRIEDIPIEESHRIVEINLKGVINGIFKVLPLLKKTDQSMIINTGSVGSFVPVPGAAVYSATKFAVRGLTEALSVEFTKHKIKVSELNPWFTETPILDAKQSTPLMDGVLSRDVINSRSVIHSTEKVAKRVFKIYHKRGIHNVIGFTGNLVVFLMSYCPVIIRRMSRKMYANYFS
jgi:NADP-dependent 3-hydroxy acid dehydrogenase YdfG